jgi:RNA dependent RNA polymerase
MFYFFSASGSQLREHSALFVKAGSVSEIYNMRDEIVTNGRKFRSVSKYLARLGLFSTSDVSKGLVPTSDVDVIRDIPVSLPLWSSPEH